MSALLGQLSGITHVMPNLFAVFLKEHGSQTILNRIDDGCIGAIW
ncbi:hypothetical protein [Haloarcula saliterrae]|nr:hypothetical protein [Haloarcula sp. S1CR25-12]